MACLFYLAVVAAVAAPGLFMWSVWRDAKTKNWRYTTESSQAMYADICKTLITASGVAVALVASETALTDPIAKFSVRVGVVSLVVCLTAGLATLLALARGHERARARSLGKDANEGPLTDGELLWILVPGEFAFASFLVGLLFLGRVIFHT